jgi:hypothetical protein
MIGYRAKNGLNVLANGTEIFPKNGRRDRILSSDWPTCCYRLRLYAI